MALLDKNDSDDEFEISLTESSLHRVVHTRPHTYNPHGTREPDLLLPPPLERFACHHGNKRTGTPSTSNRYGPLKVSSTDPTISVAAPTTQGHNTLSPHPLVTSTSTSTSSTQASKLFHPHSHPRPRDGPPPVSSMSRAAMHADRLWAEHRFNHLDLTISPDYLSEKPTNAHEASIQLELLTLWKRDLVRHMVQMEERYAVVALSKEFREMQGLVKEMRRAIAKAMSGKALDLDLALATRWEGKGAGVEKKLSMAVQSTPQQRGPRRDFKVKQRGLERNALLNGAFEKSKELNRGFGTSTTVIPFRGEVAPLDKSSEKKPARVVGLDRKGPVMVPQKTKKRPVGEVEQDGSLQTGSDGLMRFSCALFRERVGIFCITIGDLYTNRT
ncbi:hypothetical protein DE146DRAFT_204526 [Phaeosphaeria sp. MPI-PUGE-AT-0046c]|nr:hypothetical protein DE146DRAFT_204526 [Phaeosphaeria sp. MPI-PUGE-AT-0046c]